MPRFEFVVKGPPVSVNQKGKRSYSRWKDDVREAARREWVSQTGTSRPLLQKQEVAVEISYYCVPEAAATLDVDNVLKGTLDGMSGVVYEDDKQIYKVICTRVAIINALNNLSALNALVVNALGDYDVFLFVETTWQVGE